NEAYLVASQLCELTVFHVCNVFSVNGDLAGRRFVQRSDNVNESRLSRPRRTRYDYEFCLVECEVDPPKRVHCAFPEATLLLQVRHFASATGLQLGPFVASQHT